MKKWSSTKFLWALDIGSSQIRVALAKVNYEGKIISFQFEESISRGYSQGVITDLAELVGAIRTTVKGLEEKTSIAAQGFYVSVGGKSIKVRRSQSVILLAEGDNRSVTRAHLEKGRTQARLLGLELDEEYLHDFVQGYILDEQGPLSNPLGLYGRKLQTEVLLVTDANTHALNITKAVNEAGYHVEKLVFSGYAGSLAATSDEERRKGCFYLDVGARSSQCIFFQEGKASALRLFDFGADILTLLLVKELAIVPSLADELKSSYAVATSCDIPPEEEVIVKTESGHRPISRRQICQVVEKGIDGFLIQLKDFIDECRQKHGSAEELVATGRAFLLDGFLEKTETVLGLAVKAGIPKHLPFNLTFAHAASLAVVIGLIRFAALTMHTPLLLAPLRLSVFRWTWNRLKELYQDYF